ncbi:MAG: hypothetical protein AAF235_06990 [Planctomycetota bacterium]
MRAGDTTLGRDVRVVPDPTEPGVVFAEEQFLNVDLTNDEEGD